MQTEIPPIGTEADTWVSHDDGREYRILYGKLRSLTERADVIVQPSAIQFRDGRIDDGIIEPPGVYVAVGGNPLTVAQARELAFAVLEAADSMAALNPADPLDGIDTMRIIDEIARRARVAEAALGQQ